MGMGDYSGMIESSAERVRHKMRAFLSNDRRQPE